MTSRDRRVELRKPISMLLRFRVRNSVSLDLYSGNAINLSEHGAYFRTPRPLTVGDNLELFMTLPTQLTGRPPEEISCQARVVRVEWVRETGVCAAAGITIHGSVGLEVQPRGEADVPLLAVSRLED